MLKRFSLVETESSLRCLMLKTTSSYPMLNNLNTTTSNLPLCAHKNYNLGCPHAFIKSIGIGNQFRLFRCLLPVLRHWGPYSGCPYTFTKSIGIGNQFSLSRCLLLVLRYWGPYSGCPNAFSQYFGIGDHIQVV